MANIERFKKRLIRQAVQTNLDSIEGRRPRPASYRSHTLVVAARALFFILVPAALFASTIVVSNMASDWRGNKAEIVSVQLEKPTLWPPQRSRRVVPSSTASNTFSIPEPIDPAVLPLALRTIILDPGHGGDNLGTVAPEGLVEKEVTLDIAERARDLLQQGSYTVLMTRDSDQSLSLRERAEFANKNRGDIFVSIHVNWIANRELRGVETFYLGSTDDPYLEALAARENQQSGYSLADLRQILQQVYAGVRQEESRRLGESVQEALFASLYSVSNTVRNRGVKSAPFGVLIWTEMPAILAEVSCVSNRVEARLLMTPIYRQYLAESIVEGIETYSRQLSQVYQVADAVDEGSNEGSKRLHD